jgi:hypothetical protein
MPKKHKITVTFQNKAFGIGVKDRKNRHGVEVRKIVETSEAYNLIQNGDVVMSIGSVSIIILINILILYLHFYTYIHKKYKNVLTY